jgi:hypothetical protein
MDEAAILAPVPNGDMLMKIIERAAFMPELDLDRVEKLLALKERWDAAEALRAFAVAKVEFKKAPPVISKNKHVSYGTTSYEHASHDEVTTKVSEALARHGFTHSWSIAQTENKISVTCKLLHVAGHLESVELWSVNDGSGGKNSIQAIGSANTYLQRYTLLAVTGLSTSDMPDDDGKSAVPKEEPPYIHQDVWTSLHDAVHEGTADLEAAWRSLSNDTRKIIVTHYIDKWNALKAAAIEANKAKQ